jgi:hypothetical protein
MPPLPNIHAALGVAVREFPLKFGLAFAAYLLDKSRLAC